MHDYRTSAHQTTNVIVYLSPKKNDSSPTVSNSAITSDPMSLVMVISTIRSRLVNDILMNTKHIIY